MTIGETQPPTVATGLTAHNVWRHHLEPGAVYIREKENECMCEREIVEKKADGEN